MKIKYRHINDQLELMFLSNGSASAPLIWSLMQNWEKNHPGFQRSVREVVERRWEAWKCGLVAICCTLLTIAFFLLPLVPETKKIFLVLSSLATGVGAGGYYFVRPSYMHIYLLNDFLNILGKVLSAVAEHTGIRRGWINMVRAILQSWKIASLRKVIDEMLVKLASQVKFYEGTGPKTDPKLQKTREHFKTVHAGAVELGLAVENPQTYFDRGGNMIQPDDRGQLEFRP